jgi:hypothetical protein
MRLLWTLVKFVLVLALLLPLSIIALATVLGVFGALMGLAFFVLRLAVIGLVGWGVFKLASALFRGSAPRSQPIEVKPLPPVDPHYEAAMRELDRELGHVSRERLIAHD